MRTSWLSSHVWPGLPSEPRQLRMFVLMKLSAQAIITQTVFVCLRLDSSARLPPPPLSLSLPLSAPLNGCSDQSRRPAGARPSTKPVVPGTLWTQPRRFFAKPARFYIGARWRDFQPSSELVRSIFPGI